MCFDKFQIKISHYILSRGLEEKLYKSDSFLKKIIILIYKKMLFYIYILKINTKIIFERFLLLNRNI
jgi:hypothetical protein